MSRTPSTGRKRTKVSFDYEKLRQSSPEVVGQLQHFAAAVRRGQASYTDSLLQIGEALCGAQRIAADAGLPPGVFGQWMSSLSIKPTDGLNLIAAYQRFQMLPRQAVRSILPSALLTLAQQHVPDRVLQEAVTVAANGTTVDPKWTKEHVSPKLSTEQKQQLKLLKQQKKQQRADARNQDATQPETAPPPSDTENRTEAAGGSALSQALAVELRELEATDLPEETVKERMERENKLIEGFARAIVRFFNEEVERLPVFWIKEESMGSGAAAAIRSCASTLRMAKSILCQLCETRGEMAGKTCPQCKGRGYLPAFRASGTMT